MKKLVAILTALSAALCMMTACGDEKSGNEKDNGSSKTKVEDTADDKDTDDANDEDKAEDKDAVEDETEADDKSEDREDTLDNNSEENESDDADEGNAEDEESEEETTESKQETANKNVFRMYRSANGTLVDMAEIAGVNYFLGDFIICSDESKNYGIPDNFDLELFNQQLKDYINNPEDPDYFFEFDHDYFFVFSGGYVIYTAAVSRNEPDLVATYPENSFFNSLEGYDLTTFEDGEYSLDELYNICLELVK